MSNSKTPLSLTYQNRVPNLIQKTGIKKMTTILVKHTKSGQISQQSYQDRNEAIKAGKWYLSLKENGTKKYQVAIQRGK